MESGSSMLGGSLFLVLKFLVYLSLNIYSSQAIAFTRSSQFERGLIRITRRVNRTRSDMFANQLQSETTGT